MSGIRLDVLQEVLICFFCLLNDYSSTNKNPAKVLPSVEEESLYYPRKIDSFDPPATSGSSVLTIVLYFTFVLGKIWVLVVDKGSVYLETRPFMEGSKFRSIIVACASAFANICIAFGNLLFLVDERYFSLGTIVVMLLIFMVALSIVVSSDPESHTTEDHTWKKEEEKILAPLEPKSHLKRDDNKDATKTEDHTRKKEEEKILELELLLWMVRGSSMLLCLMAYFSNMEMEMTNCLLFVSCCLGELTLMMPRLPSKYDLAPASEVVHRAFLVMGLLTAHTMAAELLGEYVLLACMPELVAALVWLTIYLRSCDNNAADCAVPAVEAAVSEAELPLLFLVCILSYIIGPIITDEAEGPTMGLLSGNMSSAIVIAVLFSMILPSLCMLALRKWHLQRPRVQTTTAAPSEGAIRLLRLCRNRSWYGALIVVLLDKEKVLANEAVVNAVMLSCCILLAAKMYARAHGLCGSRARGVREKRD